LPIISLLLSMLKIVFENHYILKSTSALCSNRG
jgi:hypothetical protein